MTLTLRHAAIVPTDIDIPIKTRIGGALHQILGMYGVDEETRHKEIDRVLAMECRGISQKVLHEFIRYVDRQNTQKLEDMIGK